MIKQTQVNTMIKSESRFFKKNVGVTDRIVRFVMIDLLLGFSLIGVDIPMWVANISFGICLGLAFTVFFGYSPIYHALGKSTLKY